MARKLKKIKPWHLMVLSIIALVATAAFVWFSRGDFATQNVAIKIEGPEQVENGKKETFSLVIENKSSQALLSPNLFVELPSTVAFANGIDLPGEGITRIEAGETKAIEFVVIASSDKSKETIRARLDYSPEGVSARFVSVTSLEITIGRLDVSIVFDLPKTIYADQEIKGTIHIIVNSDIETSPIFLRVEFPQNFTPREVSDGFDFETVWRLGTLRGGDTIKREFTGRLTSSVPSKFSVKLGKLEGVSFLPLNVVDQTINISESPIILEQGLQQPARSNLRAGDDVRLRVAYTNRSGIALEDAVLRVFLPTHLINAQSISAQNAQIDRTEGTVTWDASENPELKFTDVDRSAEFFINFSIRDPLIPNNVQDTQKTLNIRTTLNSRKEALALDGAMLSAEDTLSLRIMSVLGLGQDIFRTNQDEGPHPPVAGELSTYTVRWTLTNTLNKAQGIRVEAVLPSYAVWMGAVGAFDGDLRFVSSTNTVVWTLDNLDVGVGYIYPEKIVEFGVRVQPSSQNIAEGVVVIEHTKATGVDTFTGTLIEKDIGPATP